MTGDGDDRGRGRLATLVRTVTLRQTLLATATVIVLGSGLFGGLATAETSGPSQLEAGERFHATPLDLTVERIRWSDDLGLREKPRGRYIGVVATLENTSDHLVYGGQLRASLRLHGLDGVFRTTTTPDLTGPSDEAVPRVLVLADTSELSAAAPGLEYQVVFLWEQAKDQPVPTEAALSAVSWTWRQSSLDDQYLWFDPVVTHEGAFTIEKAKES